MGYRSIRGQNTLRAILKFLSENNIKAGIKKKNIDGSKIEEEIRLAYEDIGWVSAEVKGTRLIIRIRETNMPTPVIRTTAPSHIVATKDAVIKEIITRSGTPMVKPGDVVRKGDILVSGIIEVMDDFGAFFLKTCCSQCGYSLNLFMTTMTPFPRPYN